MILPSKYAFFFLDSTCQWIAMRADCGDVPRTRESSLGNTCEANTIPAAGSTPAAKLPLHRFQNDDGFVVLSEANELAFDGKRQIPRLRSNDTLD
jgi:hypothetical protein